MVWIFSSPGCASWVVELWSPESVAEMSWFASAQDGALFYSSEARAVCQSTVI